MQMDHGYIETIDIDWFASFSDGSLAHFTTSGVDLLPQRVKASIEDNDFVHNYFRSIKNYCDVDVAEENIAKFPNFSKREQYLNSFVKAASKGIFSYDIDFKERTYFLIAKPMVPLFVNDLPQNIYNKLSKLPSDIKAGAKIISKVEGEF